MATPDGERKPFDFDRVMEGFQELWKDLGKPTAWPVIPMGPLPKDVTWEVMAGDDFVVLRAVRDETGAVLTEARLSAVQASALGKKLVRFAKAAGGDHE